jgi:hypothetical protein
MRTTEVDRDRGLEATSATTDQVALEALGLLQLAGYPQIPRAETAPGWTTWCAAVQVGRPGGLAALLQRSHAGTMINVRFRRSRRSTPSDSSDGLWAHLATLCRVKLGEPPHEWGACASEEAGFARAAGAAARPRAGDPQAGQVRPRTGPVEQVAGARRSGRCPPEWAAERRGQRTDRSDEPSAFACL